MQVAVSLKKVLGSRTGLMCLRRCLAMQVAPPVVKALKAGEAVVALESTIITHGMPYPHNLQTAERVEEIVIKQVIYY